MNIDGHNSEQVGRPASSRAPRRKSSEDGFTMLTVIFLLAILTVWMSVAVPKMTRSIQRDHEVETMHRGKQYIRAVQLYYRKFHAYPPNMDALVKTNEIRFLRKKYIDPMTGKDDWKPLMFGQNKQPIVFGFFGQPMVTGSTLAGIGASGGNGINGLNGTAGSGLSGGSQNGTSGTLGSIFNSQQGASSPSSPTAPGTTGTDTSGTDASGGTAAGGVDANGNPVAGSGTAGLASSGSTAGQTFGGAGIIGVIPASPKQSLLIYKKKTHYNEWEFDYDPAMETMMQGGNTGMIGTPASGISSPVGNSGFGSTTNTFGGGQTSSTPFGGGPGSQSPTPPASPQQ
jgi:type II secretory pathway pseudopilin PulG